MKQFDLVCNAPIRCWQDGIALGNGELAALSYTAEGFFPEWTVNLHSLWDERWTEFQRHPMTDIQRMAAGELDFCTEMQKETPPGQKHQPTPAYGVQLRLESGISPLYAPGHRITSKLSLEDALLMTRMDKHLSHMELRSFVSAQRNLLAIRVSKVSVLTAFGTKIKLFRVSEPERRSALTGICGEVFYLRQELSTMSFVAAVKVVPTGKADGGEYREYFNRITHPSNHGWADATAAIVPHADATEAGADVTGDFDLFLTLRKGDDVHKAVTELEEAVKLGWERLYQEHRAAWAKFWLRNMVSLGDPGLDQLWYLSNYHLRLGSGVNPAWGLCGPWFGRVPGLSQQLPWHGYFTNDYNAQTVPLALEAINHGELADGFYRMLHDQLPEARKNAAGCEGQGVLYSLSCGPDGREASDGGYRFCQGSGPYWCTLLYRHWLFSGDEIFLRETAWDILRETARFFASYLQWDGTTYHLECSQNPELKYLTYPDPIDTLALVKRTLEAACAVSEHLQQDAEERRSWRYILDHYPDYPINTNGFSPLRGLRPDHINHSRTLAPVFPLGELDPEFPAGQIEDARKELTNSAWDFFMKTYACPAGSQQGWTGKVYHAALPACRFGQADTAWRFLGDLIGGTLKPNGLFSHNPAILADSRQTERNLAQIPDAEIYHDCGSEPMTLAEATCGRIWEETTEDPECKEKTLPVLEGPAVFLLLVSEMLLQGHNQLVRVFPAWPKERDAQFRNLRTEGALFVSSALVQGQVVGVCIRAEHAGRYALLNPWAQKTIWLNGRELPAERHLTFALEAGEEAVFTPNSKACIFPEPEPSRRAVPHILDFGWGRRCFLGKPAPAAYYAGLRSFLKP